MTEAFACDEPPIHDRPRMTRPSTTTGPIRPVIAIVATLVVFASA
jgi:hypothetical protein